MQVQELRRYSQARGWEIAYEVVDQGYSGSTDNRPGLRQVLTLARRREIDAVIVVKLDRLFRSLKHLVTTLEELDALGVKFVATADSIDWTTPSGRLLTQLLASLAEFERSLIRERTIMGLAHARSKGKKLGRPVLHDPDAIRALRAKGLSYRQIQRRLGTPMGTITRALKDAHKSPPKSPDPDTKKSGG